MIKGLGNRIKELRVEKGISQKELASALHLAQNTIASYETAAIEPSLEVLVLLGDYFDVSTDYLLGRIDY